MPREQRLFKYVAYFSQCSSEAAAYGKCVSDKAEKVTKSACSKEFQNLIACFQKAVCHSLFTAVALDRNGEILEVESEMKIKRYKRAQRLIGFYRNNFGYVKPYRVLVDGTFCQAALTNRINLREQVSKYLNEETELATTSCVLKELEQLGPELYGALHICKQFDVDPCPHKPAKTAADCIASMARRMKQPGKAKYFLATQDSALTDKLRMIAGCPILFIKFNSILIEKPSEVSVEEAERPKAELQKVIEMKKELLGLEEQTKKKKRKGPKGPNPLSCKKKKSKNMAQLSTVKQHTDADETDEKDSRKRKRKSRRKSAGVDAKVSKIE